MAIAEIPPKALIRATVSALIRLMQSHRMLLLPARTSSARCPIPNEGEVVTPQTPSPSPYNVLRWPFCNWSNVVQCWPCKPTNWRSSSQMGQRSGGWSAGGNCVPQVTHR